MQTGRTFARSKQARHIRHLAVGIDTNPTHPVMSGWSNLHWLLRDIDIRQLLEVVIHAREFSFDVLGTIREAVFDPGDVEKHAAVRTSAPFANFTHDRARIVIVR